MRWWERATDYESSVRPPSFTARTGARVGCLFDGRHLRPRRAHLPCPNDACHHRACAQWHECCLEPDRHDASCRSNYEQHDGPSRTSAPGSHAGHDDHC